MEESGETFGGLLENPLGQTWDDVVGVNEDVLEWLGVDVAGDEVADEIYEGKMVSRGDPPLGGDGINKGLAVSIFSRKE